MAYSVTFRDTIDHIRSWLGGEASTRAQVHIIQGILSGYRELTTWRKWMYLYKLHRVYLHGEYSTGTIEYTQSTYKVDLSDGTWPSWADQAQIRVSDVVCDVDSVASNTTLVLDSTVNFGADVASNTSYCLEQAMYTLPDDFQASDEILNVENWWNASYVQPRDWLVNQRYDSTVGPPSIWTIMGHRRKYNRMALYVNPAPSEDATLDMMVHRRPRALKYTGYEAEHYVGTVSGTAGAATVTGVSTNFKADMVGSILRVGDSTTKVPGPIAGPEPYALEGRVKTINSTTSLVLEDDIGTTFATKKYVISDPIDIDPGMTEAFLRACEKNVGIQRRAENIRELDALYRDALYTAECNDDKAFAPRVVGGNTSHYRRLASFAQGADQE